MRRQITPSSASKLVEMGLAHHQAGRRSEAEACYRDAVAAWPLEPRALLLLGLTRFDAGDPEEALRHIEAAVALQPQDIQFRLTQAQVLHWSGNPSGAALAYGAAAALDPNLAQAHLGLALARLQLSDPKAAEASAERAAALDPSLALASSVLGAALRAQSRFAAAAVALERAIALGDNQASTHVSLGVVQLELERFDAAEESLRRALEGDRADKEAHAALSTLCYRMDRFEEARAHAEAALAQDPKMIMAHRNLAGIHAREGRPDEARRHRDLAYGVQNLFILAAAEAKLRVLALTTTDNGNMPDRYLLPADRYTRIYWFIEYAEAHQIDALPPYDVVVNLIADEDAAERSSASVERFLERCTRPVVNRPEAIAGTRRDLAPFLFAGIAGLVIPKVARIDGETLGRLGPLQAAAACGLEAPVLLRPIGSHGGHRLTLLTGSELRSFVEEADPEAAPPLDHYITAFHDFRSSDGLYRKYRMIFVDRRPYPYHLAISPDWIVHYVTSGTADHADRVREERCFLEDPEATLGQTAMDAIRAVGKRLDLDFCGADFTILDDGQVLLFEANATMLVHPEAEDGPLGHKNPYVDRILNAFQAMLERREVYPAPAAALRTSRERSNARDTPTTPQA